MLTDSLAETTEGARTVEALRLAQVRRRRADADIAACYAAEMYTLRLRTVFVPAAEASLHPPARRRARVRRHRLPERLVHARPGE